MLNVFFNLLPLFDLDLLLHLPHFFITGESGESSMGHGPSSGTKRKKPSKGPHSRGSADKSKRAKAPSSAGTFQRIALYFHYLRVAYDTPFHTFHCHTSLYLEKYLTAFAIAVI